MQVVVRVLVTLLALAGAASSTFAAFVAQTTLNEEEEKVCRMLNVSSFEEAVNRTELIMALMDPPRAAKFNQEIGEHQRKKQGTWFFCAAGGLALFGTFLALFARGKAAAAILLVAPLGPAVIMPTETLPVVALFTGILPVAGLLALLIRSPQPPEPTPDEE